MYQATYTNAAAVHAAGVARLGTGRGTCAYPWSRGDVRARQAFAGMNVDITESKLHHRWPGDPSS
jgi:hypothetical protein